MNWYEYLIIVAAALFVVGVIVWRIVRKVQGKAAVIAAETVPAAAAVPRAEKIVRGKRKNQSVYSNNLFNLRKRGTACRSPFSFFFFVYLNKICI